MKNKANLGAAIRHFRKLAGMNQDVFAERCGFASQSRVSLYELGRRDPSTQTTSKMCDVLGITLQALYSQAGIEMGVVHNQPAQYDELNELFSNLTKQDQFLVIEIMKGLNGEEPSELLKKIID